MVHLLPRRCSFLGGLSLALALVAGGPFAVDAQAPTTPAPPKAATPKSPPPKGVAAPRVSGPALPLEGTAWKVTHVETQAVAGPVTTRSPGLLFNAAERRVSGSTGCNRLSGRYKLDGARLTFPPFATTRMVCPDAIDLESRVLAALERVARYRIVGQRLEFLDAKGVVVMTLGV